MTVENCESCTCCDADLEQHELQVLTGKKKGHCPKCAEKTSMLVLVKDEK